MYLGSASPGKRIGDRQWICGSMPPGMTTLPVASTVRVAASSEPGAPITAILPPATPISAAIAPFGNTQVPPDMTRSSITVPRCYLGCLSTTGSPATNLIQQHVGGDVADDEHQATTVIGVGPGVKPARRIQGVLHGMDRRRPCARSANATRPFTRSRSSPCSRASFPSAMAKSSRDIGRRRTSTTARMPCACTAVATKRGRTGAAGKIAEQHVLRPDACGVADAGRRIQCGEPLKQRVRWVQQDPSW